MKLVQNDDFRAGVKVYAGLRDAFRKSMLVLVDENMQEVRTVSKLPEYNKHRKKLDALRLYHVQTPRYAEVIDITKKTYNTITDLFPGYAHTQWQVWGVE